MTFNLSAVEAEASTEQPAPFEFDFGGEHFTMPVSIDVRARIAASEGNLALAVKLMLGDSQYRRLVQVPEVLDDTRLGALISAWAEHSRSASLGESEASTVSSKSTAKRSRRTSDGSTSSTSARSSGRVKMAPKS